MSEEAGWDAGADAERVVDWDEMFGDVLPEQTGDDLADRDPSSTSADTGTLDAARVAEYLENKPPHYED